MFIAKLFMYGVLGGLMAIFGIGIMTNPIASLSIFFCVLVIDILTRLDK